VHTVVPWSRNLKPIAVAVLCLLTAISSVGASACSSQDGSFALTAHDRASIYAAAVGAICGSDDQDRQGALRPTVYIVRVTDDRAGDPGAKPGARRPLSATVRDAVGAVLENLPVKVKWVDSFDAVKLGEGNRVADGGAIVQVGSIKRVADDKVSVPVSIYFAGLAAEGKTFVLEKTGGEWTVTGTTGIQWVSLRRSPLVAHLAVA
jgi:hypothetical protein